MHWGSTSFTVGDALITEELVNSALQASITGSIYVTSDVRTPVVIKSGVCIHRRPDSFEGTFQIDETGTWTNDPVQASGRVDSEPSRRFEYTQPFAIRYA